MIYVLSITGQPLMPTKRNWKVRKMLKSWDAKIVSHSPFTIQLTKETTNFVQDITLWVDTWSKSIWLSALCKENNKEYFSGEAKVRNDVSKKMTDRRMYRRKRRSRLRYRKPRFSNRASAIKNWRLAPSVQHKIDTHIRVIEKIRKILPIKKIVLETWSFDTQKLENPDIENVEYQQWVQLWFENVKAFVLFRDKYKCQAWKTGCSEKLNVHHIKFKSNGWSDKPSNLITLCEKHHKMLHAWKLDLWIKSVKSSRDATAMSIIKVRLLRHYPEAEETFGYITKANRYKFWIEKSHTNDAYIIAGWDWKQETVKLYNISFKRNNNRKLQTNKAHSISIRRKRHKIQSWDIVRFEGKIYEAGWTMCWWKAVLLKNFFPAWRASWRSANKVEIICHNKTIRFEYER